MIEQRSITIVRYADTDQMGQVYYSSYFQYFEDGRLSLLREKIIPIREIEEKHHCYLPVTETYAKFFRPIKAEDEIVIKTFIKKPPRARIKFYYEIEHISEKIAEGFTIHAFISKETTKPVKPPQKIIAVFNRYF